MVRAFVGDSTMTSRRRAGALLVATDASLVLLVFRMVLLLITLLSPGRAGVEPGPAVDAAPAGDGRNQPDAPGRRKHGNAVEGLGAPTVHRVLPLAVPAA
jgi:hypothetical protein